MISEGVPKVIYLPNGTETVFNVTFTFFDESDLVVVEKLEDSPYTETTLVLNTDYTVTGGNGSTGTITLTTPTASTKKLIIYSDIDDKQDTDFINNSDYDQEVLERTLDEIVRMIQQKDELINRCLKLDIGASNADLPTSGTGYLYYNGSSFSFDDLNYTTTDYAGTITAGADASKPSSPTVKDIYYAIDTKRRYICYTSGTWDYDGVFWDVSIENDLDVAGDVVVSGSINLGGDLKFDGSVFSKTEVAIPSSSTHKTVSASSSVAGTTWTAITDMTVTYTPEHADNPILFLFSCVGSIDTAGGETFVALNIDGSYVNYTERSIKFDSANTNGTLFLQHFTTLSAAAHTIEIVFKAGSSSETASITNRSLTIIEFKQN